MRTAADLARAANAEIPTADYIPFGTHIAPNVIKLTRNGDYAATWRLEGITFQTADPTDVETRKNSLNNFIKALSGGQYAIWTHRLRREVNERLNGTYSNSFCRRFNEKYYDTFDSYRQMATELYITVIYRPSALQGMSKLFRRAGTRKLEQIIAAEDEALSIISDIGQQLENSLKDYRPERLTTYTNNSNIVCSEMLAFFGYLVNGHWEEIPMHRTAVSNYLPSSRLYFGDKNGMLEVNHLKGRKFAGFLDIQEYPKFSESGMNNCILYGDYEFIETQSFSILNRREAKEALERQQNQLRASEDASETEIASMTTAIDDLAQGEIEMGEYHYSLAIFGNTLNHVANNMSAARSALQDLPGFKMAVIDAIPECAWFAQLPGNWWLRPREANMTSKNFAALSPFHNFARGKRTGNPWGEALALMKTPSGQPFYFNFHNSPDNKDSTDEKFAGNTFVCGATGVGKTALIMALLAFATKYINFRCVAFDMYEGMKIGILRMGGQYFSLKRGVPTGWNPFQRDATPKNIDLCIKVVRQLVKEEGKPMSAKDDDLIATAVMTMFNEFPMPARRLGVLNQLLAANSDLRLRLKKWIGDGTLAWVFDNPTNLLDLSKNNIFGFDYTEFIDDPEIRTPMMMYLLDVTEELIDGNPFAYLMDEFWKPLDDPFFTAFAKDKQKTIRKLMGLGVFMTQSPSDVLTVPIGKTMVEQSVTQIYLPNPKADHDDYVNGFKLTEAEYNIIRNLGESSRSFLVKQGHRSAIVKFDLGGMNEELNILSGSEDNTRLLEDIMSVHGSNPEIWEPILQERIAERRNSVFKASRGI